MIPWRLKFSQIRDYPPTLIDLSGSNDHVLITGPNGAGKSTITFCMGAVLYSSKVDVEGLKSRNLLPNQTWKARISFLFKNEGWMKIDAPNFIEFILTIVQEPGQPMKKEFSVSTGDKIDGWEETIRYSSGDRIHNFSAYKKDLQYKYKIDPDLYYLIWYQQEVNQFAVMSPEERFRIFSEMHSIDKVQRDWEESMEKVKEAEETVRIAETNVKLMKSDLSMKKSSLDRFLDNQKRLHEGGKLYVQSLLELEIHYKKELERLEEVLLQLETEMEEAKDNVVLKRGLIEHEKQQLGTDKDAAEQLAGKLEEEKQLLKETNENIKQMESAIEELNRELEAITERQNQIRRTEEEVRTELQLLSEQEKITNKQFGVTQTTLTSLNEAWKEKVNKIAGLDQEVKQDERLEIQHRERLTQYKSSHDVQEKMNLLEQKVTDHKGNLYDLSRKQEQLSGELHLLREERELSVRQVESMKFFRAKGMKAYPLRELIELDERAQLKDEQLFNAIKYTIFFNGKQVTPPNDLYHVPLMTVIPDRVVTGLPSLHLQVKKGIYEEDQPHAMKALWWVAQFFKEGSVSIKNGIVVDPMGLRGTQEKDRYILSVKAIKARKQEVEKELNELDAKIIFLEKEIESSNKKIQELNSVIHQVKESEAFMIAEHERILKKKKLEAENNAREEIDQEIIRLKESETKLVRLQISQESYRAVLEDEAAVYVELGKMKGKYEERNDLQKQCSAIKDFVKHQKRNIESLEERSYEIEKKIINSEREINKLTNSLEDAERNISDIVRQKNNRNEDKGTIENEIVQVMKELNDLQFIIPTIYAETTDHMSIDTLSKVAQTKQNREKGKVMFDNARMETGIDPAAPENYETVKQEFERLENEYKRTIILLDQDKERTDNLKDKLETTINMRVLELQRRFKIYMGQFQFEGDISWDSYEDRRKRTHFSLYIKARKEGHRGTMEDVSTKARGGKVGKGVSGGEESLSSLLFALALLQNLQTSPGFIVLDEFDSALDENRKVKVFDLYEQELKRKLIILTPKSHEETYLDRYSKAFIVQHDPTIPQSKVVGIVKTVQES